MLAPRRFIVFVFISLSFLGCSIGKRQVPQGGYRGIVLSDTVQSYPVNGVPYYPLPRGHGFVQEGVASWYGRQFHRRRTASGEVFNMYGRTAAHRTLPFGTYVKVENLSNQREVVVRINDRGPFVKGRIIDLSYGAAREVGLIGPGVTNVRLVALSKRVATIGSGDTSRPVVEVVDLSRGVFTVQVGAFEMKDNARRLARRLRVIFDTVTVTTYRANNGKTLYRVRVTASKDLTEAHQVVRKLEYLGFSDTFVVAL